MDNCLDELVLNQQWRNDAVKMLVLVADAPPHDENLFATWQLGLEARSQQIHIVPVAASGVKDTAEFMMRSLAVLTHSRYLFLTDDSGVGHSHQEPNSECYVVTRLDHNLRRVIASLFLGQRQEPQAEEIIRTKGDYQNGICVAESVDND